MKTDEQTEAKNGHLSTNGASPTGAPGEVSGIPVPEAHPLAGVIGGFADDPLWDEFLEQMQQARRELAQAEEKTP